MRQIIFRIGVIAMLLFTSQIVANSQNVLKSNTPLKIDSRTANDTTTRRRGVATNDSLRMQRKTMNDTLRKSRKMGSMMNDTLNKSRKIGSMMHDSLKRRGTMMHDSLRMRGNMMRDSLRMNGNFWMNDSTVRDSMRMNRKSWMNDSTMRDSLRMNRNFWRNDSASMNDSSRTRLRMWDDSLRVNDSSRMRGTMRNDSSRINRSSSWMNRSTNTNDSSATGSSIILPAEDQQADYFSPSPLQQRVDAKEIFEKIDSGESYVLNINFDEWESAIDEGSDPLIQELYIMLNEHPLLSILVEGHTDNTGDAMRNQILSEDRAMAVIQALIKKGVDVKRLKAVGYGLHNPIGDNDTEEGRALNRRVEIRKMQ